MILPSSWLAAKSTRCLCKLGIGDAHVGRRRVGALHRHGEVGLRRAQRDLERRRIDPEQHLPLFDLWLSRTPTATTGPLTSGAICTRNVSIVACEVYGVIRSAMR